MPAAAVQLGPQGPYVFVDQGRQHGRGPAVVDLKRTQGGESVIGNGLKAGERVVVDGQLRLVNGAAVALADPRPPQTAPAAPDGAQGQRRATRLSRHRHP